jgi:MFS family permease
MSDQVAAEVTPQARATFSGWRLWYMVVVLCSTNVVAFIDRASLPLLARQIEHDLHISDSEMGLLIGAAFIITFFGLAIPAGVLLDRFPRRPLMAMAIGLWAACTIGCGFAYSFVALFLGRIGVGAGEAFCGPGSLSIVRDAVPADKRGRAVAIWAMGANIGAAIALLAGGAILLAIGDAPSVTLPVLGTIRSWQFVLICCGLLAAPVALLLFTFPEPPRTATGVAAQGTSIGEALRYVGSRWPIFLPLFIVNGLTIIMTVGSSLWMPLMFGRVFHLGRPEIGFTLGLMSLCLAMPSQFIAGIIMDWLHKRGVRNPIPPFGAIVTAISLILGAAFPLAGDATTAWVLLGAYLLIGTSTFTVGTALVTRLSPPAMSGKVMALHFLWVGLMGTLVGGQLYPGVSDLFFGWAGEKAIAYSLSTVIGVLGILAVVGYVALILTTQREQRRAPADAIPA